MSAADDSARAATVVDTAGAVATPQPTGPGAGTTIDRYRLERRLGAGAMGEVWAAHDPKLDRKIALKLVHPRLARTPEVSSRLQREARAMAKLSHRSVVTVFDAGEADGQLYLAMEFVPGTTLGAMLRARDGDALDNWRRWLALVLDAGRGLVAAHACGILHRDFKPDNVLVDDAGRVCVSDFGLATDGKPTDESIRTDPAVPGSPPDPMLDATVAPPLDLTTTGTLLGTPAYMSPQQLRGERIDARADQFNFCVTCYEALYGRRPFETTARGLDALPALEQAIESGELPPPPPGSTVPTELRTILARGLAADPTARWPDMAALVGALERASASAPPRRKVAIATAFAAVLALGVAGAVVATRPHSQALIAKQLFPTSMRTSLVVSPDGKRLALAGVQLEVRDLSSTKVWQSAVPNREFVSHVEFVGDDLRYALQVDQRIRRWHYSGDKPPEIESGPLGGMWCGTTAKGDLVYEYDAHALRVIDHGREVMRWPTVFRITNNNLAISPDRTRVAYLQSERFDGRVVVRDLDHQFLESSLLASPTAVAWIDDTTLVYATGIVDRPTIYRVTVTDHMSEPTQVFAFETGWVGQLAAFGRSIFLTELHPSSRVHIVERNDHGVSVHDLDPSTVGVALGWTAAAEYLTWNQTTHVVARGGAAVGLTPIKLDDEPINSSLSGDVLIAALRRQDGRQVVAMSLATGKEVWRGRDHLTLAVRCAADRRPPCFAIRRTGVQDDTIVVSIDPSTGVLGSESVAVGSIDDIAVDADGTHLVVADSKGLFALELATKRSTPITTPVNSIRSVAYDPAGGVLVTGSWGYGNFYAGSIRDGVWTLLAQADDGFLALIRPSPDGTHVFVLSRVFAPTVWQLTPP